MARSGGAASFDSLPPEVTDIIVNMYAEMDTDGSGWLSREELQVGFTRIGLHLNDTQTEVVFRGMDKNNDEKITLNEFVGLVTQLQTIEPKETERATLRRAFTDFDENKDGFLSEKELRKGLKKAGYGNITKDQLAEMTADIDKNGDGKIDFEEFVISFSIV